MKKIIVALLLLSPYLLLKSMEYNEGEENEMATFDTLLQVDKSYLPESLQNIQEASFNDLESIKKIPARIDLLVTEFSSISYKAVEKEVSGIIAILEKYKKDFEEYKKDLEEYPESFLLKKLDSTQKTMAPFVKDLAKLDTEAKNKNIRLWNITHKIALSLLINIKKNSQQEKE